MVADGKYIGIPETAQTIEVRNTHVVARGGAEDVTVEELDGGVLEVRRLRRSEVTRCMTAAAFTDNEKAADVERLSELQIRMAVTARAGLVDQYGVAVRQLREKHPVLGDIASVEVFDAMSQGACVEALGFATSGLRLVQAKNSGAPRGTSPGGANQPGPVLKVAGAPTRPACAAPVGNVDAPLPAGAWPAGGCGGEAAAGAAGGPAGEVHVPGVMTGAS